MTSGLKGWYTDRYTAQKVVKLIEMGSRMNRNNLDSLTCIYCEGFVAEAIDYSRTQICVPCNEYKSVVTVREYLAEYGNDLVTAWMSYVKDVA